MQFPVWIVVRVMPAGALLFEPRVEAGGDESVGALLALGRADREMVGVLVLGVVAVAAHPAPLDGVAGRRLNQLLPQRQVLDGAALPPPAARDPSRDPFLHSFDQVFGVGHVGDAGVAPLAVQPFERRDRTGQRHAIVGRVGGALVKVPACHTVARGCFDQRAVAAGIGWLRAVAEAALVGMHEDVDRRRPVGHLRVGSPPGCRCGVGSPRRGTRRRRWGDRAGGSGGPRRTARRTGSA